MTSALVAAAIAVAPSPVPPTHQVVAGESLSWIAQCELGDADRWPEVLELNLDRIADPNVIGAGWELALPADASGQCPERPPVLTSAPRASSVPNQAQEPTRPASSSDGLSGIRRCESGGDYGAVSESGRYRGAYQFDQQTWESAGGSGDPAAASPAEQDQRASALYQSQGSSPWPSCG